MAGTVFIIFGIFLILSIPIGVAMAMGSIAPLVFGAPGASSIQTIIRGTFGGADSTPIIAVPLFILAGVLMAEGGISKKLFNVFAYFIGSRTAGMPSAVVITCLFYGAISGSGPATTAAVGAMTIPVLVSLGYDKTFCAALVATAGGLGVIIPPSIPFVLYSLATGESTGALFIAGVLPGILIGLFLIAYTYVYFRINGEDKEKIRANHAQLKERGFWNLFKDSFWALLSPVIILGGIYSGIVTPTEAACISVFYSLIVSIYVYKTMSYKDILPFLRSSVKTYAPLLFILAFATAFGRTLALIKAPALISGLILGTFTSQASILFIIVLMFLLLGMVMDTGPAIVIMAPILLPIVEKVGVDPIHFGVIMVVNLAIGLVTPPFGLNLFVASSMTGVPAMAIGKKAIPLILTFVVALLVITYVPQLSLVLLGR
ncbi:MAG: TRAP transporter large permease [Clostridia bacterium]